MYFLKPSSPLNGKVVSMDMLQPHLEAHELWVAELYDGVAEHMRKGKRLVVQYAELRGLDLSGIDLSYAKLAEVDLCECDLSRAKFVGASLTGVFFDRSRLFLTNFQDSVLTYCSLQNTKEAETASFNHATIDAEV